MKKLLLILVTGVVVSCNVSVDHDEDKDSTSRLDSAWEKTEDKLEQWGDTAKSKYKDVKEDIRKRLDDDDSLDRRK